MTKASISINVFLPENNRTFLKYLHCNKSNFNNKKMVLSLLFHELFRVP